MIEYKLSPNQTITWLNCISYPQQQTIHLNWLVSVLSVSDCTFWHIKGEQKTLSKLNFVLAIWQLIRHWNLKILVPAPHNTLVIMWGRDKNVQVLMLYKLTNCEIKISIPKVFYCHPLLKMINIYVLFHTHQKILQWFGN